MRSAIASITGVVMCALCAVACSGQLRIDDTADAGPADAGIVPEADGATIVPEIDSGVFSDLDASIVKDSGLGGGDCPVPVTTMDVIEVHPPRDNTHGSCTDVELTKVTGRYSDILAAVSPTCGACLFTEANDMTNSQFFVWADATHITVSFQNFGACTGSSLSGGNAACGKAAEELNSCLDTACPRTPTGSTACTDITEEDCITTAVAGDCKAYDDSQTINCGGPSALKAMIGKCFDSTGSPTPGIKLLCGPGGSVDAGGG